MTKRYQLLLIATLFFIAFGVMIYWYDSHFYASTDNAYVNANTIYVAPRITGQVARVYVINNQHVQAGQLLFELDAANFNAAVKQAAANLAIQQAKLQLAELTAERTSILVKRKVASLQQGDADKATLSAALAAVNLAKADLEQAQLNLQYTRVKAPESGWVTNVSLHAGDAVIAHQTAFELISDRTFWLDANFKETQLAKIQSGQKAEITLDMYPGHRFSGVVESVSYGTGAAFSLFPPENAAGNWIKVTQRIPVRIAITEHDAHYPFRIGSSASVSIYLQ